MKRFLNIPGGLPLRCEDFDLVQDAVKAGLNQVIQGILEGENSMILSGCKVTVDSSVTCLEGWVYVDGEIFYIAPATFTYSASKILYIAENFTTDTSRTFKDASTHNVHQNRDYAYGYATELPEGAIAFDTLYSMQAILKALMLAEIGSKAILDGFADITYLTGFTAGTSYPKIRLQSNGFNTYMLHGAFNATASAGKIGVLPAGTYPSGDVVGFFYNGAIAPGVLKIKKNGDIYVSGASTSAVNYISFQFLRQFEDNINYTLPSSGGGGVPDGDHV